MDRDLPLAGSNDACLAILWIVSIWTAINLVNWMDGQGWYFNPFAWQFLFAHWHAARPPPRDA